MDRCYRYIWGNKRQPPLIQMQEERKNMFDVRAELGVKSIRWKIEKKVLERIGHVMRMGDDRMTKACVLGWMEALVMVMRSQWEEGERRSVTGRRFSGKLAWTRPT